MIEVRCLRCKRKLFNESLVEGKIEIKCRACRILNVVERKGIDFQVKQTLVEETISIY